MTLEEFVQNTLTENNLPGNVKEIIGKITEIAKQRAVGSSYGQVAYIDPEEVREMVINNAELSAKLAQEKEAKAKAEAEKKAQEERIKAEAKAIQKREKALEKEKKVAGGEQTSLFGWPSL